MSDDRRSPFRPADREPLLQRVVPVAKELPSYRAPSARRDALAAVTVAALAIPSAMAYAELAGVSPVAGLYALLLPAVAYALLGSSRQLIVGPEGVLATLVAAAILPQVTAGSDEAATLAAWLALAVGACFLVARAVRIGWLADYLSRPVLVGYIHGIVVVLVVGQLGKLAGLSIEALDPIPQLAEIAREIGGASAATLAVSAAALAIMVPARRFAPRLPAALVVVVAAIAASAAFDLGGHGVAVVGEIPAGLPPIALPTPSFDDAVTVLPAAVGIFLVCFADAMLNARTYAGRHGQHVDVRQELVAIGVANAAAGMSAGVPVGASASRTAVNDSMGARSQVSGLLAAGVIAVVLLLLTAPIADLPTAVLGAAIVVAAIGLVDLGAWRELRRADRVETAIAAVAAAGVVMAGVLEGIVFAVGLSIVDVVRRSATPHDAVLGWVDRLGRWADVAVHRDAEVTPGVVVYRLDDRLFFANAAYVRGRVAEAIRGAATPTRALVLDAEAIVHVDAAGAAALREIVGTLRADGVAVHVARLKEPVRLELERTGVLALLEPGALHGNVDEAVRVATAAPP